MEATDCETRTADAVARTAAVDHGLQLLACYRFRAACKKLKDEQVEDLKLVLVGVEEFFQCGHVY